MSRRLKRALLVGSALLGLLLVGVWGFWPWYDVDDQSAEDDERATDSLERDRDRRPGGSIRVPTRPPSPYLTARTTEEEGAGAGMFEGQVLSWATGEPVPEVELTFARESTVSSTMTDLEGGFYFRASVAGTYELVAVTADGYLPFAPEWGHSPVRLEARPGYRVRDIIIHLRPVEELVGVVTSPDGRPVAGAEVAVISTPAGRSSLSTFPESYVSTKTANSSSRHRSAPFSRPDWPSLQRGEPVSIVPPGTGEDWRSGSAPVRIPCPARRSPARRSMIEGDLSKACW